MVSSVSAQAIAAPVSLTLTASEHVWLRVVRDGQTAFEGLMKPDETCDWGAVDQLIELLPIVGLQHDHSTESLCTCLCRTPSSTHVRSNRRMRPREWDTAFTDRCSFSANA